MPKTVKLSDTVRIDTLERRVTELESKPEAQVGERGATGCDGAAGQPGKKGEPGERGPKGSGFFG